MAAGSFANAQNYCCWKTRVLSQERYSDLQMPHRIVPNGDRDGKRKSPCFLTRASERSWLSLAWQHMARLRSAPDHAGTMANNSADVQLQQAAPLDAKWGATCSQFLNVPAARVVVAGRWSSAHAEALLSLGSGENAQGPGMRSEHAHSLLTAHI